MTDRFDHAAEAVKALAVEEANAKWGEFSKRDTRQGAFEHDAFVDGAAWLASRLTREKIQDELAGHWYDSNTEMCDCGWDQRTARDNSYDGHLADAILRLIGGDDE